MRINQVGVIMLTVSQIAEKFNISSSVVPGKQMGSNPIYLGISSLS